MKRLFFPSIALMNKLRIPRKFLVLAVIYLAAVGGVGYSLNITLSQVIGDSRTEIEGLALLKPVTRTMQLLQQHRGLTSGLLSGDESMREAQARKEEEVTRGFMAVEDQLAQPASLVDDWRALRSDWEELKARGLKQSTRDNFREHTLLIERLQIFRGSLADQYTLSFDPDIDAHYLLDTAIVDLPVLLEKIAQLRGLATGILANKQLAENGKPKLYALISELHSAQESLSLKLAKTARFNPGIQLLLTGAFENIEESLDKILGRVQSDILDEAFATPADQFFQIATLGIDQGYQHLYQTLLPTSANLIDARIQRAREKLLVTACVALLLLLIAYYFFVGIYYSTVDSIRSLARSAGRFAAGDMQQRVSLDTRDELSQLGDSFNHMADGFNALYLARLEDEERLRAIVNSALDAVIQMDTEGGENAPSHSHPGRWLRAERPSAPVRGADCHGPWRRHHPGAGDRSAAVVTILRRGHH